MGRDMRRRRRRKPYNNTPKEYKNPYVAVARNGLEHYDWEKDKTLVKHEDASTEYKRKKVVRNLMAVRALPQVLHQFPKEIIVTITNWAGRTVCSEEWNGPARKWSRKSTAPNKEMTQKDIIEADAELERFANAFT